MVFIIFLSFVSAFITTFSEKVKLKGKGNWKGYVFVSIIS